MQLHENQQGGRAPACAPSLVPGSPDRCARFLARLETHLAALADDAARGSFIDRQLAAWQRRYLRFLSTEGGREPAADGADLPQAADFLLTISALAARRRALGNRDGVQAGQPMAARHRPGLDDDKRLAGALLSLLVAADQRCPAIIGQAHLLYHLRPRAEQQQVASTLARLKRDAEELIGALAKVEAAINPAQPDLARR
jgi:hypothetical protein